MWARAWLWVAAAGAIAASPCLANEYLLPIDRSNQVWIVERSGIELISPDKIAIHYLDISLPAQEYRGRSIYFKMITALLDCKMMTYRFGSAYYLNDDFTVATIATAPDMKLSDPVTPAPSSPFSSAVHALCSPGGPHGWSRAESELHDFARQKLRTMQAHPQPSPKPGL